jgi:hypothetical protein
MADDYNQHDAERRHYDQMRELQGIRDNLNKELDYYYNYVPRGEGEERDERLGLRDRLSGVRDRLETLIRRLY